MWFIESWSVWAQIPFWVIVGGWAISIVIFPLSGYKIDLSQGKRTSFGEFSISVLLSFVWPVVWWFILKDEKQKLLTVSHMFGVAVGLRASKRWWT